MQGMRRGLSLHSTRLVIFRFSPLLLSCLLLAGCVRAPKAPTVREPFWSWNRFTERRMAGHLADAAKAWDVWMNNNKSDAERDRAEAEYEHALKSVLKEWNARQLPRTWETGSVFASGHGRYQIDLQPPPGNPQEISPLILDRLRIAEEVHVDRHLKVTESGLGVPLVGEVSYSEKLARKYPLMPLNGGHLTLTALLEFQPKPKEPGQPRLAKLRLYNPLWQSTAQVERKKVALSANYSAAKKLALDDGFLHDFSLIGALFPEKTVADCKLYQLEIHDPKRIPVIFVHGLMSDPHIWYECINGIYADPVLRANYQPWYFLYPTGMGVPTTANRLRQSLQESRAKLDPENDDPAMNEMVLVGHSMGGLLSRMQVADTGNKLWHSYFKRSPEQLRISDGTRERLKKTLIFEKQPYVKRLIFIAVPQRGSEMADFGLVHRIATLIRLPIDSVLLATEILSGNSDALNQQVRDWGMFAVMSIGTLSPKHPFLHALDELPIPVPHHSIIGRVGDKPLEESSDRVVPYKSAHLKTGTEKVVPYWHCCTEEPEVIQEVKQRLHEHLRKLGRTRD